MHTNSSGEYLKTVFSNFWISNFHQSYCPFCVFFYIIIVNLTWSNARVVSCRTLQICISIDVGNVNFVLLSYFKNFQFLLDFLPLQFFECFFDSMTSFFNKIEILVFVLIAHFKAFHLVPISSKSNNYYGSYEIKPI